MLSLKLNLSYNSRCFASLIFFFVLVNEIMQPLIYALAQSHRMRGDILGETFVSRYSSVVTNVINSLSFKSDAFNLHCLVVGL